MRLIIDIGNTLLKYAVFHQNKIIDLRFDQALSLKIVDSIYRKYPGITSAFIASVRKDNQQYHEIFSGKFSFLEFNNSTLLPITNRYNTPETLGKDRLAAAIGASAIFPKKNVLSVDAGTCITYDLINKNAEYLGGGISAGIRMRYNALHSFTGNLPLVKPEFEKEINLIGKSTEESIQSGVQNAVLAEVDAVINQYKDQFEDLKIIVTGGDYKYFDKYLKNNIFASPNLVLIGLKKILDFNENK